MPSFGVRSLAHLSTCDPLLQQIAHEAMQDFDFAVICGHRDKEGQDKAVAEGKSKTPWPTSKHNAIPSQAMDLVPYPVDWKDRDSFTIMARVVLSAAEKLGIELRWGGDFNRDGDMTTNDAWDLPHFELVKK